MDPTPHVVSRNSRAAGSRSRRRAKSGSSDRSARIAEWLRSELPAERDQAVRESLEWIAAITGRCRVLLAWEEPDEPWLRLAHLNGRDLLRTEVPPGRYTPLVAKGLSKLPFHLSFTRGGATITTPGGNRRTIAGAVNEELRRVFSITTAIAVPLAGRSIEGRLFLLDTRQRSSELFSLATVVSAIAAARVDQIELLEESRRVTEAAARRRVARDLHDGLLQSFTGVVLQLETVYQILESDVQHAREMITEVEGTLMADQRELRRYIEQLRPGSAAVETSFDVAEELRKLGERYHSEWGIEMLTTIGRMPDVLYRSLGWETYRIVSEAVTNAARHGGASTVRVDLSAETDRLCISVEDDGSGFPFRGRYNLQELEERHQGPVSLRERVRELNGSLTVESTDEGSRLEIFLPLGWRGE